MTETTKTTITVCDDCRVGVHNDDWTHLDFHHEGDEADNTMTRITAMLEIYGWLTEAGKANENGYFDCDLCWETQCGGGYTFETAKEA